MLDDSDDRDLQRAIRRQADEDVAAFLAGLQGEDSGVPPPPQIKVSEVKFRPGEPDMIGFGQQGSGTQPAPGIAPPLGGLCDLMPSAITVTPSGIVLDCDCIDLAGYSATEPSSISWIDVAINTANSTPDITFPLATGCINLLSPGTGDTHFTVWSTNDCTYPDGFPPYVSADDNILTAVGLYGGIWYVTMAPIQSEPDIGNGIFFYGQGTSDINDPISNQVTCTEPFGFTSSDAFFQEFYGTFVDGSTNRTGFAHGGTITLSES